MISVVSCACPIIMADNGSKALGSAFFDAENRPIKIVVDEYFVEECWRAANGEKIFQHILELAGDDLIGVLCHEIAHLSIRRHGRKHRLLTSPYIAAVHAAITLENGVVGHGITNKG